MRRAILHIGTEKTGTTSIQKFLYENRIKLGASGSLFPSTAGFISNQNLVVYGKQAPEADLAPPSLDVNDASMLSDWKEAFAQDHCREVLAFQARHARQSTVIYSAEHLQSRLTQQSEIKRVARLLRPMFEQVSVLVYLRRQDRYAVSAHSTSVRGGDRRLFDFEAINAQGPYYNYRELLHNWSEVFGSDNLVVRLFEKPQLHENDVIADFCLHTGIDKAQRGLVFPEPENESLSFTALEMLRDFNSLAENDPRLCSCSKSELRPFILKHVQGIKDEFGRMLPARCSAETFYARFRDDNQQIFDQWLAGKGFDESFDDYPPVAAERPELKGLDAQLDALIESIASNRFRRLDARKLLGFRRVGQAG